MDNGFSENMKALLAEITKRHYKDIVGLKADITTEDFYYFLEVLPPIYSKQTGFLLQEAETHNDDGEAIRLWFYGTEETGYHCEVVNEKYHVSKRELIEAGMI